MKIGYSASIVNNITERVVTIGGVRVYLSRQYVVANGMVGGRRLDCGVCCGRAWAGWQREDDVEK